MAIPGVSKLPRVGALQHHLGPRSRVSPVSMARPSTDPTEKLNSTSIATTGALPLTTTMRSAAKNVVGSPEWTRKWYSPDETSFISKVPSGRRPEPAARPVMCAPIAANGSSYTLSEPGNSRQPPNVSLPDNPGQRAFRMRQNLSAAGLADRYRIEAKLETGS